MIHDFGLNGRARDFDMAINAACRGKRSVTLHNLVYSDLRLERVYVLRIVLRVWS